VLSIRNWLEQHSTRLTSLVLYSTAVFHWSAELKVLCPQLRQLSLAGLMWQLEPAAGRPGLLHGCTGLTALDVSTVAVRASLSRPAAAAAIAALTALRSLQLEVDDSRPVPLQFPLHLTKLSLHWSRGLKVEEAAQLSQLSGLVNLEHLRLSQLPCEGVPGGVPSQLAKLTRLHLAYREKPASAVRRSLAEQLHALSSFTSLRELYVASDDYRSADGFSGVKHLSKLTSLGLHIPGLEFSNTHSWVRSLTALEGLCLKHCDMQAEAVACLAELRSLSLDSIDYYAHPRDVLNAVSQLTLLTQLHVKTQAFGQGRALPAAAFTVLAASTNLLQLSVYPADAPPDWALFRPGSQAVSPHLRVINLTLLQRFIGARVSEQQLQQLCRCCPALERLYFDLAPQPSPTALLPLLQLSALTLLGVDHGPTWPCCCSSSGRCSTVDRTQGFGLAGSPEAG
jgi:hypothetical protein